MTGGGICDEEMKTTCNSTVKDLTLILYYHKASLGLVNFNFSLPAVVQRNVCNPVQHTEKITLIISNSSLCSVSVNTTSFVRNIALSAPYTVYIK